MPPLARRLILAAALFTFLPCAVHAACSAVSASTAPSVSGTTVAAAYASNTNYYLAVTATAGGTALYSYDFTTLQTTFLAGSLVAGSSNALDGTGSTARFSDSVTSIAGITGMQAIFVIDGSSIRAVNYATNVVTTVLQDPRISSTTRVTERSGVTYVTFGACLYSATTSTASLGPLTLLAGNCSVPRLTNFSADLSAADPIPVVSALSYVGPLIAMYATSVGILFTYDTRSPLVRPVASAVSIKTMRSTSDTILVLFSDAACDIQYADFSSTPTLSNVLLGGTPPSSCAKTLLAASSGSSSSAFYQLRQVSRTVLDSVVISTCPLSSSSTPSPSTSSGGDSGLGTGALIGIVVGSVSALILVTLVVAVVITRRASSVAPQPAGPAPVTVAVASGRSIEIPPNDPFENSREVPISGTPAGAAGRILTPHFVELVARSNPDHDQMLPERSLSGANLSTVLVSDQKRRLTQESSTDGFVITALSRGDFSLSQQTVSLADIERHNKRCEYVATGAYQKGKILGRGSNGTVQAILLKDGSTIAMKEVALMGSEEEIRRQIADVQAECRLLQNLQHPNLVTYYGVQSDNENLVIRLFMENVTGGSIGAMVRSMPERLSEDTAKIFTQQILKGLSFIHSQGIIHRDLKCDNILRDSHTGLIKLADFGTAKYLGNSTNRSRAAQTMIGTPYLMAPEILMAGMGETPDAGYGTKADIWSLGITVAEMLNKGNFPWPAFPSPGHAFLYIASPQGVPIMPDGLSPECQDFIRQCTDRDPKTRPSAAELLLHDWLMDVIDGEPF